MLWQKYCVVSFFGSVLLSSSILFHWVCLVSSFFVWCIVSLCFHNIIFWRDFMFFFLLTIKFCERSFHSRIIVAFVICILYGRVICCCVGIILSSFSVASSSQRAVKRDMAKLFTIMAFDDQTILSGVTKLVTFAAEMISWLLWITLHYSLPILRKYGMDAEVSTIQIKHFLFSKPASSWSGLYFRRIIWPLISP